MDGSRDVPFIPDSPWAELAVVPEFIPREIYAGPDIADSGEFPGTAVYAGIDGKRGSSVQRCFCIP